ncbi:LORF2 protein, partial [Crocuta crocuta]
FLTTLFTIAKIWKQHKCPLVDEWIKKIWYVYNIYVSKKKKKNETLPFVTTSMDREGIMLSEISQRQIPHVFT